MRHLIATGRIGKDGLAGLLSAGGDPLGRPHPAHLRTPLGGEPWDVTSCPGCGAPAEITDRSLLESTDGPIEHAQVHCARRHRFLLSIETLQRTHRRLAR